MSSSKGREVIGRTELLSVLSSSAPPPPVHRREIYIVFRYIVFGLWSGARVETPKLYSAVKWVVVLLAKQI